MAWGAQLEDKQQQEAEEAGRLTPLSVLVGLAMAAAAAAGVRAHDAAAGNREARLARQAWIERHAAGRGETSEAVSRAREALAKLREDQASRPTRSRPASTGRADVRER